jgi:uncharacterized coiled-coil DUF342 family protein
VFFDNVLPTIIGMAVTVGLISVVLTRLWVKQISLNLEKALELNERLVPLQKALVLLRDAVSLAHAVAKELDTLRNVREEASTLVSELRSIRDDFAEIYNTKLEDVDNHRATLNEMVEGLRRTHQIMDDTYLRTLVWNVVTTREEFKLGGGLIGYLEENGYRVNAKLKGLITEFYGKETSDLVGGHKSLRGGVENEHA